jgi:hypothetical protein
MSKTVLLSFVVVFASGAAFAAGPDTIWTKTYASPDDDACYDIFKEGPEVTAVGTGGGKVWLMSLNPSGDTMWSRLYGGSSDDAGTGLMWHPEGFFVTGWTESFGAGNKDLYMLRTDQFGDTLWTATFGGAQDDGGEAMVPTMEETPLVVGWTGSFGGGNMDMWIVRFIPGGDTMWSKAFGGSNWDAAFDVIRTSDDAYVIVGGTASFGAGGRDGWVIKMNAEGDTLWSKTFGGSDDDVLYSITTTPLDEILVAGYTESFGAGGRDGWLMKMTPEGDTIWSEVFGGEQDDVIHAVYPTMDEAIVCAGYTVSSEGDSGMYMVKAGPEGGVRWYGIYGSEEGADVAYDIVQTDEEYYLMGGLTTNTSEDLYLVLTEPNVSGIAGREPGAVRAPSATVTSGAVLVPGTSPARLLDVSGSRVTELSPGRNDIRHLNPGVYYVVSVDDESGQKLLLVR